MRQGAIILAIIALYGVIAYSIGIPLPPQPWRSYFGLAALEALLIYYHVPVIERMLSPTAKDGYTDEQNALVRSIEVTKMQRVYLTLVMVCSFFGMTAVLCCHDGVWSGPQTETQTAVVAFLGTFQGLATVIPAIVTSSLIEKEEKALAESLSPSAPVESGTVESGAGEPDLEAGLDSKK